MRVGGADRISAIVFVLVTLMLAIGGTTAVADARNEGTGPSGTDSLWGWVTARRPTTASYTPAAKDQGSSVGGTNTVERIARGRYRVEFGSLDAGGGTTDGRLGHAQATALSNDQRSCTVVEMTSGLPVQVFVFCRDLDGHYADSAFSANFLATRVFHGNIAYLYADQPDSATTYQPDPNYDFNANAPDGDYVERLGTGHYHVFLVNQFGAANGNLQVTGTGDSSCRISERFDNHDEGDDYTSIDIKCFDGTGAAADVAFFLAYTDGNGLKGTIQFPYAYLFANKPTTASYTPRAGNRASSAETVPTVTRSGIGTYLAMLPGMPLGGSAQVTAFNEAKVECQLSSVRKSGGPQRIGVLCFKPNGQRVDSRFYLTFTK